MQEGYHLIANNCKEFCYKFCTELLEEEQLKVDPLPFGSLSEFVIRLERMWETDQETFDGSEMYQMHQD